MDTELGAPPVPAQGTELEAQAALFAELADGFARTLDLDATLRTALLRIAAHLDAEAASIFFLEEGGRVLRCRDCVGPVDITGLAIDARHGIVGRAVRERACLMVRDVLSHPDFAASVDAGTGFETRSLLCAPLLLADECLGAVECINKRSADGRFDARDQHLLSVFAAAAAMAVRNARTTVALVERDRIRRELDLAREIQERMLPDPDTDLPVAGLNLAADGVSGDFFDFQHVGAHHCYFSIGDVSGKGMNAALLMARTCGLLRCLARNVEDPSELLARVNHELVQSASRGMFVTVTVGILDLATGLARIANAGHPPALLREASGRWQLLECDAPPLGIEADLRCPTREVPLAGAALHLYSDGLLEARRGGEPLGLAGLGRWLERVASEPLGLRLPRLVECLQNEGVLWNDDLTALVVEGPR
jgi:sigma-B regulation protein RsbU (phosphoserine phosphatase)